MTDVFQRVHSEGMQWEWGEKLPSSQFLVSPGSNLGLTPSKVLSSELWAMRINGKGFQIKV